jgi:hypothetical protein
MSAQLHINFRGVNEVTQQSLILLFDADHKRKTLIAT